MSSVELHHEQSGDPTAPPLLLGGSLGTTLRMWDPQSTGLSDRLRVVAFDHRGHGSSPAPRGPYSIADLGRDVLALMDRLELERASFGGLSIGGMVGIWLGENAPERIERLVLMCTAAKLPGGVFGERAQTVRTAGTPEVVADAVVSRWFTPHWADANPEVVATCRAMVANTDAEGYASCCDALEAMDLRPGLSSISAPTLVIGGVDDLSIPPDNQRAIAEAVPGARLELIDDAAHVASLQHPDTVNRLIAEHLLG